MSFHAISGPPKVHIVPAQHPLAEKTGKGQRNPEKDRENRKKTEKTGKRRRKPEIDGENRKTPEKAESEKAEIHGDNHKDR